MNDIKISTIEITLKSYENKEPTDDTSIDVYSQ